MANFVKHVGKHGDRKVAVVFRQIPGEEHMALVVYTQLLNQNIHDPLISAIETPQAQMAKDLGDALNKTYTKDGKIILQVLHIEGMLKKVNTEQIMMTPSPKQQIKLSELNKLLNEMDMGEAAVRRMAELDASRGIQDPADIARRMRGETPAMDRKDGGVPVGNYEIELANNLRQQATKMEAEAKGLLAESQRLQQEAAQLEGTNTPAPAKKPGRVKKTKAAVAG